MTYFVTIGHRRKLGGHFIKEQMIVEADSYDVAWRIAEGRCYNGECVLNVEVIKQPNYG